MSGSRGVFKKLFGLQSRLSKAERADLLAQSPFEISEYHAQGMSMAVFFVLDTRLEGNGSGLPPNNAVKELMGEVGPRGRAMAESWVIENLIGPSKPEPK